MSLRLPSARNQLHLEYAESDLARLQQQYRRAKETKRAYTEKAKGLILRDTKEIQMLQGQRKELLSTLRVSDSCSTWTDACLVQDIGAMLAGGDRIEEDMEAERGKAASLREQISKWELKLAGLEFGGGDARVKSETSNVLRNTGLIENKLHRSQKCFNETMIRNGELREELNILQWEKKQFFAVNSRLEKELQALRKDISSTMTKCTEAFEVSVKLQEKQKNLREQSARDVAYHLKERNNLDREVANYNKFQAFLDIKVVSHTNQDSSPRKVDTSKPVDKHSELEDFEEAITAIVSESGESDLDKMLGNFVETEEQNYSLLKFVSYQQDDAEALRRQISQLSGEREIFVVEQQQKEEQNQTLQVGVATKLEAAEQHLAVYQQRVGFMEKLLDQLKIGVASLLRISQDSSGTSDQPGSSDGVQNEYIREYLRMVEDRVNELLTLQSYLHLGDDVGEWDIDSTHAVAGQLLGLNPQPSNFLPAASTPAPYDETEVVESVLLEAKEPMSREDLLMLVNKRIQRRTD